MHLRKCIVISIFLQILQFVSFSNMYINLSIYIPYYIVILQRYNEDYV